MDVEKATALIIPELKEAWQHAWHILSRKHLDTLNIVSPERYATRALSPHDIKKLLDHKIISYFDKSQAKAYLNVFTVLEEIKKRRRLILEPVEINEAILYAGEIHLPSLEELESATVKHPGALCLDFDAYFNAFLLPRDARAFFCFLYTFDDGSTGCFALNVIATGQRICPSLAQALSRSIATRLEERFPNTIDVNVYLDNLRILGEEWSATNAWHCLLEILEDVGIKATLDSPWQQTYDYIGIKFSHCTASNGPSVQVARKTLDKIGKPQVLTTMRDVLSTFGKLLFGARVLGIPLAKHYYLFKFLRRRSYRHLDDAAEPWAAVYDSINSLRQDILANPPRLLQAKSDSSDTPIVAFTDSSLDGWGAVLFHGTMIDVFAAEEDIQILEARAALKLQGSRML